MISSLSGRLQDATLSLLREPLAGLAHIVEDYAASRSQNVLASTSDLFTPTFDTVIPAGHNIINRRTLGGTVDISALYTKSQVQLIQATACSVAGLSLLGGLITLYWFCRMKKKFRHKSVPVVTMTLGSHNFVLIFVQYSLIIILITGDLLRSLFLFVFPLVSLIRGHIQSKDPFCQASGYLTQTGIEVAGMKESLLYLEC